jgi:hypothetical protein
MVFIESTAKEQKVLPSTSGFVRYLGAFEHLHWLFSQSGPRAFAFAIEVTGTTTVDQWRTALDALQLSQPLFSVKIDIDDIDDDKRPYFRQVDDSPIPMRVLDGRFTSSWEVEMAKENFAVLWGDQAPLLRTVLIHEAERSIFIITAHHSIGDGVSMAAALCDLVRALSGEQLERRPMLPSPEDSLDVVSNVSTVQDKTEHTVAKGNDRTSFAQGYVEPFTIQSLRLDASLTGRIRERAREEETTLHGALCSAVIHAARTRSSARTQEAVRLLSPFNARNQCGGRKHIFDVYRCGDHTGFSGAGARSLELGAAYQVRAHWPCLPTGFHSCAPDDQRRRSEYIRRRWRFRFYRACICIPSRRFEYRRASLCQQGVRSSDYFHVGSIEFARV